MAVVLERVRIAIAAARVNPPRMNMAAAVPVATRKSAYPAPTTGAMFSARGYRASSPTGVSRTRRAQSPCQRQQAQHRLGEQNEQVRAGQLEQGGDGHHGASEQQCQPDGAPAPRGRGEDMNDRSQQPTGPNDDAGGSEWPKGWRAPHARSGDHLGGGPEASETGRGDEAKNSGEAHAGYQVGSADGA